jgi:hypothetical protein
MSEEKKGHLKMTFELEMNEPLMDVVKDAVSKMPQMMMKRAEEDKK